MGVKIMGESVERVCCCFRCLFSTFEMQNAKRGGSVLHLFSSFYRNLNSLKNQPRHAQGEVIEREKGRAVIESLWILNRVANNFQAKIFHCLCRVCVGCRLFTFVICENKWFVGTMVR